MTQLGSADDITMMMRHHTSVITGLSAAQAGIGIGADADMMPMPKLIEDDVTSSLPSNAVAWQDCSRYDIF